MSDSLDVRVDALPLLEVPVIGRVRLLTRRHLDAMPLTDGMNGRALVCGCCDEGADDSDPDTIVVYVPEVGALVLFCNVCSEPFGAIQVVTDA